MSVYVYLLKRVGMYVHMYVLRSALITEYILFVYENSTSAMLIDDIILDYVY